MRDARRLSALPASSRGGEDAAAHRIDGGSVAGAPEAGSIVAAVQAGEEHGPASSYNACDASALDTPAGILSAAAELDGGACPGVELRDRGAGELGALPLVDVAQGEVEDFRQQRADETPRRPQFDGEGVPERDKMARRHASGPRRAQQGEVVRVQAGGGAGGRKRRPGRSAVGELGSAAEVGGRSVALDVAGLAPAVVGAVALEDAGGSIERRTDAGELGHGAEGASPSSFAELAPRSSPVRAPPPRLDATNRPAATPLRLAGSDGVLWGAWDLSALPFEVAIRPLRRGVRARYAARSARPRYSFASSPRRVSHAPRRPLRRNTCSGVQATRGAPMVAYLRARFGTFGRRQTDSLDSIAALERTTQAMALALVLTLQKKTNRSETWKQPI
ncbi:MAG: hypothetical protein R3B70_03340 [Polyangiaceae bacterium]